MTALKVVMLRCALLLLNPRLPTRQSVIIIIMTLFVVVVDSRDRSTRLVTGARHRLTLGLHCRYDIYTDAPP